jgi:hypothetical protein
LDFFYGFIIRLTVVQRERESMMTKKSELQRTADVRNRERYSSRSKWKESKKNLAEAHTKKH